MEEINFRFKERDINDVLAQELRSAGYWVLQEVRVPPNELDLIVLDPLTLHLTCFEIKRNNWKTLLQQAVKTRLYGHYSIAVLPKPKNNTIPLGEFEKRGVGVLYFYNTNGKFEFLQSIKPEFNTTCNRFLKRNLYKRFGGIYHGGTNE